MRGRKCKLEGLSYLISTFHTKSNDLPGAPKADGAAAGAPNGVAGAGLPNGAGVGARNYQYDVSVLRT